MRDLIRDALEHRTRGECPDAALLAAYADRTLDRAERASVVSHLADCDRCRATLMLMSRAADTEARSAAAEAGSERAARQAWGAAFLLRRWPWLAGAAAAGLAVMVWSAGPLREQRQAPARPIGAPAQPPAIVATGPTPEADMTAESQPARRRQRGAAPQKQAERRADERVGEAPAAKRFEEAKPTPPASPSAVAETVTVTAADKPIPRTRAVLREGLAEPRAAAESTLARDKTDAMFAAAPPDGRTIWRARESGVVERSVDAGATWTRESGIEAPGARAIASPSAAVCWIVGQAGLVLRYEAPIGWTRVPAPAALDFVGVTAADARQATITAADGRRFSTVDGGVTWKGLE